MDTFEELIAAVCDDLNIPTGGSSLYPLDTIKRAINRAYSRAGGVFRWPETEDAQMRNSIANAEYYDYPKYWRPDSMFRLEIDGVLYGELPDGSPIRFSDFRNWRLADPNSTELRWATQWRRFFLYPIITTSGTQNIKAWGQKAVAKLEFSSDTTIFSFHMRECNDAVVKEAVAILQNKGESNEDSQMSSASALTILSLAFTRIQQEQSKYKNETPMFTVPDYYAGFGSPQITGNFRR